MVGMKPYSMDLRERVAEACERGKLTRTQVAERFSVSMSFIRRLMDRKQATGSLAPKPHAGGFASAFDAPARQALRDLVGEQPDATLKELRQRLAERGGPSVTEARVCQVLGELRLPRKKSPRRPASGTGRTSGPHGRSGTRRR